MGSHIRIMNKSILSLAVITVLVLSVFSASLARADGSLNKVNHIIIVMQENHSFDNYFGVLPYAKHGLFHPPPGSIHSTAPCNPNDHQCVDGLRCSRDISGNYTCVNSNAESNGTQVFAFHDNNYCPAPDLDHGWPSSHREANFSFPNSTLASSPNDGFVRVNDATEQLDTSSGESTKDDDTMGFYNETDLPYYYALAQTFAIDDRYFCDVIGPTVPNRFYLAAATSFGHLTTSEVIPPSGGYKPITGTIFDLLDKAGVPWVDYFTDLSQAGDFRNPVPPNILPVAAFFVAAATGTLPPVTFVDPELLGSVPASAVNGGLPSPSNNLATDE